MRIADAGGLPQVLSTVRFGAAGGTWNSSGTILFGSPGEPLRRVADTGGVATPATKLDPSRKERTHAWPVFLPDGRRFLYLAQSYEAGQAAVYEGSLDSTDVRRVFTAESNIGLDGGQVFSVSKGVLAAQGYDADRARVGGASITIAEQIAQDTPLRSGGAFSVAAGVVAYRSASPDSRLIWFDRTGKEVGSFPGVADYHHPWLSPDEKRVAVEKTDPATGRHSIWILDLARGTSSRLVLDPAGAHQPAWSPDGRQIWFSSNRLGGIDLYRIEADGTGSGDLVLGSTGFAYIVTDWSHDGRVLLQIAREGQRDLAILPLSSPQKPQRFLDSVAQELQGQFSPNLQWVAYTSDESGSPEVYLRRHPAADGKRRVSTHGGAQPRWRRDGKELFYLAPDGRLMVVDVNASSAAVTGPPRALFDTGISGSFLDRRNQYLVTRDGQRFLVNLSAEDTSSAPITVMMHWASPPGK